ncbi:MAG: hypothetical protein AVDCRST_MAG76-1536, partial [uncultured Acidimicrobiales bacterium]
AQLLYPDHRAAACRRARPRRLRRGAGCPQQPQPRPRRADRGHEPQAGRAGAEGGRATRHPHRGGAAGDAPGDGGPHARRAGRKDGRSLRRRHVRQERRPVHLHQPEGPRVRAPADHARRHQEQPGRRRRGTAGRDEGRHGGRNRALRRRDRRRQSEQV